MISRLSKVKVTLSLLLTFGAIFALSSCGGNKSEREYTEGNILSIECIEGTGMTMDADIQYRNWGVEEYYRDLYLYGKFFGKVGYSSGDSSATMFLLSCEKDMIFRLKIDGCPVDKIVSAYAKSDGKTLDIDINDYISFKQGKIKFTYSELGGEKGCDIYLTVASTANRKTASFIIGFPVG